MGVAGLEWLARQTDDAIVTGIKSLRVGMIMLSPGMLLLNPIIARRGVDERVIPIPGLFGLVSIVGALAFIFGLGLFAGTILLTSSSRFITQPWGRGAVLLFAGGVFGLIVSFPVSGP